MSSTLLHTGNRRKNHNNNHVLIVFTLASVHGYIYCRLSEWEQRYKMRGSKPEDLDAIRELKMIVREQEQKIKDLVVHNPVG